MLPKFCSQQTTEPQERFYHWLKWGHCSAERNWIGTGTLCLVTGLSVVSKFDRDLSCHCWSEKVVVYLRGRSLCLSVRLFVCCFKCKLKRGTLMTGDIFRLRFFFRQVILRFNGFWKIWRLRMSLWPEMITHWRFLRTECIGFRLKWWFGWECWAWGLLGWRWWRLWCLWSFCKYFKAHWPWW